MNWIDSGETLLDRFHQQVAAHPDRVCIRYGQKSWNYQEWQDYVQQLTRGFAAIGVQPRDTVMLALPNCPEVYASILAVNGLGAIGMPLNIAMSDGEIAFQVEDAGCQVGLVTDKVYRLLQERRGNLPFLRKLVVMDGQPDADSEDVSLDFLLQQCGDVPTPVELNPIHVLLYTSGTTGFPKGALLPHSMFIYALDMLQDILHLEDGEVCVNMLPNFHLFSIGVEYWIMLATGGTFVIRNTFDLTGVLQDISQYRATWAAGTPSLYNALHDGAVQQEVDMTSLHNVLVAGTAVSTALSKRWEALTQGIMFQVYGMTEIFIATIEDPSGKRKPGSSGTVHGGAQLVIVDEEDRLLPYERVGEVVVRLPGGVSSYWNRPEQNELTQRNDWFHTGDLGYLDRDNFLYVVDRKKDRVYVEGREVYSAKIEKVLMQHPDVSEAAVVGLPVEDTAEVYREIPIAVVLPRGGVALDVEELLEFARANLEAIEVPQEVRVADGFPRTATGKIRKFELRDQMLSREDRNFTPR